MKKNGIAIVALLTLILWGAFDYLKKADGTHSVASDSTATGTLAEEGVTKGKRAPDFQLTDLNGKTIRLSDYSGKTVLVNFWATWCPPCRIEMPHMEEFYRKYNDQDTVILGINLTHTEKNLSEVQAFVSDNALTFPILYDKDGKVSDRYQITAYPTTLVVDPSGIILNKFQGAIDFATMKDAFLTANKGS
ncbi:TlpA family protein disulfide reductase [Gorillibacterium sp. sgz500922]|uniref:TlpA family protein disulfide reductase n=1 Tax=Gorillibacterium sp. sgz500922 TaxID=3446694 RepID=UPI003F67A853